MLKNGLLLLLLVYTKTWAGPVDSVRTTMTPGAQQLYYNGSCSASYIHEHNWNTVTYDAITLFGNLDIRSAVSRSTGWSHSHSFLSEISYLHPSDSGWLKNSDFAKMDLCWSFSDSKRLRKTVQCYWNTQWLNSWSRKLTETGYRKYWKGGFLNPAELYFSYGKSVTFFTNSRLTLSYVSVRLSTLPRLAADNNPTLESDRSLLRFPHSYLRSEYGCSASLNMVEPLYGEAITNENNTRFFVNALNNTGIHFECSNRIVLHFLKYLQLRLDTRLNYNPDQSTHLQYRQEVVLGVFYQQRKQWAQH